jgi:pyruvate dehydrogenase E1 component
MNAVAAAPRTNEALDIMVELDRKVHWLSAWTIHNANHIRENRDGLKVGGHQASSASLATVMSALYFGVLRPEDRVAVKPHASPVFHAIQYLYGRQSLDQLQRFRALGGAQSYPSRTKDKDDVDFSTGSVGLGVAISAFAAMTQDYLEGHGWLPREQKGRMISLLGDAELDEGNIYECLIEGAKHDLRDTWWIVDYNRQSLDATTSDRGFERLADIFTACGWQIVTIKYGRLQEQAFAEPGGQSLKDWIDTCPNDHYAALTFKGGAAWRERLSADIGANPGVRALLDRRDDEALARLMTNLGGHDLGLLLETFRAVADDRPRVFIAYTVKGMGLPFQGHKDNHSGLMTETQMDQLRQSMGIAQGREWEPFEGLPRDPTAYQAFLDAAPFAGEHNRRYDAPLVDIPDRAAFPVPTGRQSTQVAFGKVLNELSRAGGELADAIVTTSPDVTVSTNLGAWVNQRGLFSREARADTFKDSAIASPQKWLAGPKGQHIELGIAENNLFLMLTAAGLSGSLFGKRLMPIGTVYDPFIARGLDALNYGCYQDSRFMLVATPSGLTLAPEGGAHQSMHSPLIGMAQDKLAYFEPAFVDELAEIMRWGFGHMQAEDGGSVYLRLSTRALDQPERTLSEDDVAQIIEGGYWRVRPGPNARIVIAYCGVLAPEAQSTFDQILEDDPDAGLLAITSPDRLHSDWTSAAADRAALFPRISQAERLMGEVPRTACVVTMMDGPPATLTWLGGVVGHRVSPLGLTRFGQSGDIQDLYRTYRLDADAAIEAAAVGLLSLEAAPGVQQLGG